MEVGDTVPTDSTTQTEETTTQPETAQDYMGYDPEVVATLTKAVEGENLAEEAGGEAQANPQDLINKTLKEIKVNENGKFVYPEDMDPMLKAAVAASKSFRDTQASYTKAQQKNKALEAELAAMREEIVKDAPRHVLNEAEQKQLNELKYTDPDKWLEVMKRVEEKGAEAVEKKFGQVREQSEVEAVVEERKRLLADFNDGKEQKLTQEQLELEVPAKWINEVVEGKVTFEDFLDRANLFIYGNKVIAPTPKPEKTTNLNKESGSSSAQKSEAPEEGINYAEVIF